MFRASVRVGMFSARVIRSIYFVFPAILTALVMGFYSPGFTGIFLLDDFHSLEPLANIKNIGNLELLAQYVFGGNTGPTGRPISLFTFALNSQVWPTSPYPFLATNAFIHAFNSMLVFIMLALLFSRSDATCRHDRYLFPALGALLWALHPYHVSTVLYVVQRMTLLAGSFTLMSIIFYLMGRARASEKLCPVGIVYLSLSAISAVAALLCKENAVLIPLQLLVVEAYLRLSGREVKGPFVAIIYFVIIPASLVVLGYLLKTLMAHCFDFLKSGHEATYGRDFTMFERLYTQVRVVGEYLQGILLPRMFSGGVFQDNYLVSKSLFSPPSTLIWLVCHMALVSSAIILRRQMPVLVLGVGWFYISHLLESTVVMLELKFEHRNYLPSVGITVIIAYLLCSIPRAALRNISITIVVVIYLSFLTSTTSLWGDPFKAAMVWVESNPRSHRALEHAARQQLMAGNVEFSKELLSKEVEMSGSPTAELRFIAAFCDTFDGQPSDWNHLAERIAGDKRDWRLYQTLRELLENMTSEKCSLVSPDAYKKLLDGYRRNRSYEGNVSLALIDNFEIYMLLHFGYDKEALAIDSRPSAVKVPLAYIMSRAAYFASSGHKVYAASRLGDALRVAKINGSEDQYTLRNASEMLDIIQSEIVEETENDRE